MHSASPLYSKGSLTDLEQYLSDREAEVPDLTPGTAAGFVWADGTPSVTDYSLVYLHGFSATRKETWPLSDNIARRLGANLYYPRLTGHGSSGKALAGATASAWMRDTIEAIAIGQRIGKKVILVGMSTGATLAVRYVIEHENPSIVALVCISPNFGLRNRILPLFASPVALPFITLLRGNHAGFRPFNPEHQKYWTNRYPLSALRQLLLTVAATSRHQQPALSQPVLIVYSPDDRLLAVSNIHRFYRRLKAPAKELFPITGCDNRESHVIAGTICAPSTTRLIEEATLSFLKKHLSPP